MASHTAVFSLLRAAFPNASKLDLVDESGGCGSKYTLHIVDESFEGQGRLARHRAVNESLATVIGDIHALSIKAKAPSEVTEG
jgi:BolA protein